MRARATHHAESDEAVARAKSGLLRAAPRNSSALSHGTGRAYAIAAQHGDPHARIARFPLFGVPFAVKDNVDVAGAPTTAACRVFAYVADASANVVRRLVGAGAVWIGKTNLDQFATGLVGTRSPYGQPASVFDAERISGGSSSGSAVAVASGLVAFALGTDTAGSGRAISRRR